MIVPCNWNPSLQSVLQTDQVMRSNFKQAVWYCHHLTFRDKQWIRAMWSYYKGNALLL